MNKWKKHPIPLVPRLPLPSREATTSKWTLICPQFYGNTHVLHNLSKSLNRNIRECRFFFLPFCLFSVSLCPQDYSETRFSFSSFLPQQSLCNRKTMRNRSFIISFHKAWVPSSFGCPWDSLLCLWYYVSAINFLFLSLWFGSEQKVWSKWLIFVSLFFLAPQDEIKMWERTRDKNHKITREIMVLIFLH